METMYLDSDDIEKQFANGNMATVKVTKAELLLVLSLREKLLPSISKESSIFPLVVQSLLDGQQALIGPGKSRQKRTRASK